MNIPAPPLNHPARLDPAVNSTAVYYVLNLPVGSLPITRYTKEDMVTILSCCKVKMYGEDIIIDECMI